MFNPKFDMDYIDKDHDLYKLEKENLISYVEVERFKYETSIEKHRVFFNNHGVLQLNIIIDGKLRCSYVSSFKNEERANEEVCEFEVDFMNLV